ncbi:MAG: cyclic nucleotide-binding domain-containing protein [bacterium]|nr:cyclic nucleotide-binding domain-containing protein [bacterium]
MSGNLSEQIKLIEELPGFSELDPKDIAAMLRMQKIIGIVSYRPKEKIITEKEFDRKIFLMIRGKAQISKEVLANNRRQDKIIKTVEGNGLFIGEISAITGKPRTASVIAIEPTVCVVVDIAALMNSSSELLERVKSKFYPKLFELICYRLEETSDCFVMVKQKIEVLEQKLLAAKREKLTLRKEFHEGLRRKNVEIRNLESKLEQLEFH